jgi:hypothetical protein
MLDMQRRNKAIQPPNGFEHIGIYEGVDSEFYHLHEDANDMASKSPPELEISNMTDRVIECINQDLGVLDHAVQFTISKHYIARTRTALHELAAAIQPSNEHNGLTLDQLNTKSIGQVASNANECFFQFDSVAIERGLNAISYTRTTNEVASSTTTNGLMHNATMKDETNFCPAQPSNGTKHNATMKDETNYCPTQP